MQDDIVHMQE
jgi:hypothetical protein